MLAGGHPYILTPTKSDANLVSMADALLRMSWLKTSDYTYVRIKCVVEAINPTLQKR